MLFLAVLLVLYGATWLIPPRSRWTPQSRWRVALALGMTVVGITHLVMPTTVLQHLPEWAPMRSAVVFITGLVEIAFGVVLLLPTSSWRPRIGWALAAYLVAVFPGNIYVAITGVDVQGQPGGIYAWLRLLMQPLFVWLALWTTGGLPMHRPADVNASDPSIAAR